MTTPALPILILAAGASARMGGVDKLLEPVRGQSLLADRISAARSTGQPVLVTLPPKAARPDRWNVVEASGAQAIDVPDAAQGMAASLRAGIAGLATDADGVMILLADMPDITTADICLLIEAFDADSILRGTTADGRAGHPVLFPARDFEALKLLEGDRGAGPHLARCADRVRLVPLPDDNARTDLDTPEAWQDWRDRQAR